MKEQRNFRELNTEEIALVSGGVSIPGALGAVVFAAQIGWNTGMAINSFNRNFTGMSFGEALYRLR